MLLLGSASVVASAALVVWLLATAGSRGRVARANLLAGYSEPVDLRQRSLQAGAGERIGLPFVTWLAGRARRVTPVGWVEALSKRIRLAGMSSRWPVERVLAAKVLGAVTLGGLGLLRFTAVPSIGNLLFLVFMVSFGFFFADVIFYGRASERQETLRRDLPDILDQITIGVEAGLGFDAAIARTATSSNGPLAIELRHMMQDLQLGVPRLTAFENLVERTDVDDLRHFVLALSQAEKLGIPIASILRVQAEELREKRRQRAEERAYKVPVKVIFPLVFCIFPVLFIIIIGPAAIRIAQAGIGG